jgi:GNAT superfamily N-acetyltransferase
MKYFSYGLPGTLIDPLAKSLFANITEQVTQMYLHMPGVAISTASDWLGIYSNYSDMIFNSVYQSRFTADNLDQKVTEILSFYSSRSHLPMTWAVTPFCQPQDLSKVLERHGFKPAFKARGMCLHLDQIIEPTVSKSIHKIVQVSTLEQLSQWFVPIRESFNFSDPVIESFFELFRSRGFGDRLPWKLLLGTVEGKPVSSARLFFAAGVAGIYHVATIPAARGRGYGTEITLASLQLAKNCGYKTAILLASPSGYNLYRRLGFQECATADVFISPEK